MLRDESLEGRKLPTIICEQNSLSLFLSLATLASSNTAADGWCYVTNFELLRDMTDRFDIFSK